MEPAGDLDGRRGRVVLALGYRRGEAYALAELGLMRQQTGDPAGAEDAMARVLEIRSAIGNLGYEAWALDHYAATAVAGDDVPRAFARYS